MTTVTSPAPEGVAGPTPAEAAALQGMLRGVVTSGSGSFLADVPGPPVIAKTGTAEFEKDGRLLTHAWMIAAQGDLAVAVFVDEGSVRLRYRRPAPRAVPPGRRLSERRRAVTKLGPVRVVS